MINDKDEWGNIELPGLSDEELYSKNWNIIASNREKAKDPKWVNATTQASRKKAKDPKWLNATKKGTEKRKEKGQKLLEQNKITEFRQLFGIKDFHLETTKTKMSQSATERWTKSRSKVSALGVIYDSIYSAGLALGIHKDTVVYRIKTKPKEYFYIE